MRLFIQIFSIVFELRIYAYRKLYRFGRLFLCPFTGTSKMANFFVTILFRSLHNVKKYGFINCFSFSKTQYATSCPFQLFRPTMINVRGLVRLKCLSPHNVINFCVILTCPYKGELKMVCRFCVFSFFYIMYFK